MTEPGGPAVSDRTISARTLLRWQLRRAHHLLDAGLDGLSAEVIARPPPIGLVSPGASFAQIVVCEDLSVNGVLAAGVPLALSTWAGRTGLSELSPVGSSVDWRPWAGRVRLDVARLRRYAQTVYAATDAYIDGLSDDPLAPLDNTAPACLLTAILLTVSSRRGEITCLRSVTNR